MLIGIDMQKQSMTIKYEDISSKNKRELFLEMATNVRPNETGLPMVIWISTKDNSKHACRIKVQNKHGEKVHMDNFITVSVCDEPQIMDGNLSSADFKIVKGFIKKHKTTLIEYWNDKIGVSTVLDAFRDKQ